MTSFDLSDRDLQDINLKKAYLFEANLTGANLKGANHGETFVVQTPDSETIEKVNLIRLSSVTHAFNQNQRINRLTFVKNSDRLTITTPAHANLAPPGHYMLFLINSQGVPSVAHIMQIGPEFRQPCDIYLPKITR